MKTVVWPGYKAPCLPRIARPTSNPKLLHYERHATANHSIEVTVDPRGVLEQIQGSFTKRYWLLLPYLVYVWTVVTSCRRTSPWRNRRRFCGDAGAFLSGQTREAGRMRRPMWRCPRGRASPDLLTILCSNRYAVYPVIGLRNCSGLLSDFPCW